MIPNGNQRTGAYKISSFSDAVTAAIRQSQPDLSDVKPEQVNVNEKKAEVSENKKKSSVKKRGGSGKKGVDVKDSIVAEEEEEGGQQRTARDYKKYSRVHK